jgi:hypothetical protein
MDTTCTHCSGHLHFNQHEVMWHWQFLQWTLQLEVASAIWHPVFVQLFMCVQCAGNKPIFFWVDHMTETNRPEHLAIAYGRLRGGSVSEVKSLLSAMGYSIYRTTVSRVGRAMVDERGRMRSPKTKKSSAGRPKKWDSKLTDLCSNAFALTSTHTGRDIYLRDGRLHISIQRRECTPSLHTSVW